MASEQDVLEALQLLAGEEERIMKLMVSAGLADRFSYSASLCRGEYGTVMVRLRANRKVFMNYDKTRCDSSENYCGLGMVEQEIAFAVERLQKKRRAR